MLKRVSKVIKIDSLLIPFMIQIIDNRIRYPTNAPTCLILIGPSSPKFSLMKNLKAYSVKILSILKFYTILINFVFLVSQSFVAVSIISFASCLRYVSIIVYAFGAWNSIWKRLNVSSGQYLNTQSLTDSLFKSSFFVISLS